MNTYIEYKHSTGTLMAYIPLPGKAQENFVRKYLAIGAKIFVMLHGTFTLLECLNKASDWKNRCFIAMLLKGLSHQLEFG